VHVCRTNGDQGQAQSRPPLIQIVGEICRWLRSFPEGLLVGVAIGAIERYPLVLRKGSDQSTMTPAAAIHVAFLTPSVHISPLVIVDHWPAAQLKSPRPSGSHLDELLVVRHFSPDEVDGFQWHGPRAGEREGCWLRAPKLLARAQAGQCTRACSCSFLRTPKTLIQLGLAPDILTLGHTLELSETPKHSVGHSLVILTVARFET
jgi:hypothetical protein